jgi:TldD protein
MKAPFSDYLNTIEPALKELISELRKDYDYVSILSTDSPAFSAAVQKGSMSITTDALTSERGMAVRLARRGHYMEYALNDFDPDRVKETADQIRAELAMQEEILKKTGTKIYTTPLLADEDDEIFYEAEAEELPEEADAEKIMSSLQEKHEAVLKEHPDLLNFLLELSSTHISKMFLSSHKTLKQSYVIAQQYAITFGLAKGRMEEGFGADSGLCGLELGHHIDEQIRYSLDELDALRHAERIEPGEYEIITSPEVTGVIAHEAFGHGMEMDMFVKNRALAKTKMNTRIGSDLVTMHEGALCAQGVTSYAFDDEGTRAGDVTEIDHGMLVNGIADALTAARLGIRPTGNGKRQNFEHKVYTRMTNTLFDSGTSTKEEMIGSVKHGYLLQGLRSGMEDPKHWGIQCILQLGREIRDGKLTGKVVAPIIMTGYVPDLLGNISMTSGDRKVFGSGYCGKGYKEFVKVTDGGPYLKTKARLG